MSMIFLDGFDHYNQDNNLWRKWDNIPQGGGWYLMNFPQPGRFPPAGATISRAVSLETANIYKTLLSGAHSTWIVGFAYVSGSITSIDPSNPNYIVSFNHTSGPGYPGSSQVSVRLSNLGYLSVWSGGTLLSTSSLTLTPNIWYYIQFKATISATLGSYTLAVTSGGTTSTWLSATGINTDTLGTGTVNQLQMVGITGPGVSAVFDDLYLLNGAGTLNNDFLGECRIYTVLPNGAGSLTQLAPSPSTNLNWQNVDDTDMSGFPPNYDASYNYSNTPGQIDLYRYPSVIPTAAVSGLQVNLWERKDDTGGRLVSAEYQDVAGVNYAGALQFNPSSDYYDDRQIYETDPATGVAWTAAPFNDGAGNMKAHFGIKIAA